MHTLSLSLSLSSGTYHKVNVLIGFPNDFIKLHNLRMLGEGLETLQLTQAGTFSPGTARSLHMLDGHLWRARMKEGNNNVSGVHFYVKNVLVLYVLFPRHSGHNRKAFSLYHDDTLGHQRQSQKAPRHHIAVETLNESVARTQLPFLLRERAPVRTSSWVVLFHARKTVPNVPSPSSSRTSYRSIVTVSTKCVEEHRI
jgi:hypothetical protein